MSPHRQHPALTGVIRSGRSVADLVREAIRRIWLRPKNQGPVALWDGEQVDLYRSRHDLRRPLMRPDEPVFVDSGVWIALALTRDPLHPSTRFRRGCHQLRDHDPGADPRRAVGRPPFRRSRIPVGGLRRPGRAGPPPSARNGLEPAQRRWRGLDRGKRHARGGPRRPVV
jgi:hypothetical protein